MLRLRGSPGTTFGECLASMHSCAGDHARGRPDLPRCAQGASAAWHGFPDHLTRLMQRQRLVVRAHLQRRQQAVLEEQQEATDVLTVGTQHTALNFDRAGRCRAGSVLILWREVDGPAAAVAPSAGKDVSSLLAEGLHSGEVVREQIIEEHALDLRQTPLIGGPMQRTYCAASSETH
jgi:hypothetical protein